MLCFNIGTLSISCYLTAMYYILYFSPISIRVSGRNILEGETEIIRECDPELIKAQVQSPFLATTVLMCPGARH